jgi:hypothetical protein
MPIIRLKELTSREWPERWSPIPLCIHPEHEPPRHIVIKQREIVEYECPAYKKRTILRPSMVAW